MSFEHYVAIYDIDEENSFLIGDKDKVYLISYDKSKVKNFSINDDPNLQYYYISKSSFSKTGFIIVFHPIDGEHLNEWGDLVQFELNLKKKTVGNKIGIVR